MTRIPVTAPPGYVTVAEAARLSGLSQATVLRRVTALKLPTLRRGRGSILLHAEDVAQLKPREPADTNRVAVQVRVPAEEHPDMVRAAGAQPVSSWMLGLARSAVRRHKL